MYEESLPSLVDAIRSSNGNTSMPIKLVAVDGHGGSGKSTLADILSEKLNAEIIHTDDFASWDNPRNWWPQLISKVLEPLKQGSLVLSYKRSSWSPDKPRDPIVNQPVTPVIILEGVGSARKEFRQYISFAVWVETPRDLCITRGVLRDGEHMRGQWEEWWDGEEQYISDHDPLSYVDVKIAGS